MSLVKEKVHEMRFIRGPCSSYEAIIAGKRGQDLLEFMKKAYKVLVDYSGDFGTQILYRDGKNVIPHISTKNFLDNIEKFPGESDDLKNKVFFTQDSESLIRTNVSLEHLNLREMTTRKEKRPYLILRTYYVDEGKDIAKKLVKALN